PLLTRLRTTRTPMSETTTPNLADPTVAANVLPPICEAIRTGQRFLLSSHARPDGDSIGSQLAMAYALETLGKDVRIVNADAAPDHYREFPGVERIEITKKTDAAADGLIGVGGRDVT